MQTWSATKTLVWHWVLVLVAAVFYLGLSPGMFLSVAGMMVAPYFWFIVWREWRTTPIRITPILMFFFWQSFALGVAAVRIGFVISDGESLPFGRHAIGPTDVAAGYLIGLIGTACLHVGLHLARPKVDAPVEMPAINELLPKLALLFAIGLVVTGLGQRITLFGALLSGFDFASHAALFSFLVIPPNKLRMSEATRVAVLLGGTLLIFMVAVRAGTKMYYMLAASALVLYLLQSKRVTRHLPLAGVFLLFLYLTVIAPTVAGARHLRSVYRLGHFEAQVEAFKTNSPLYTGRFSKEFYSEQVQLLGDRLFEAISIGFIYQNVQVRGYLNGLTFEALNYALIPRVLWPEKPIMARGGWFTHYVGLSPRETDSTVSIGMEAAGEFYWNFGIIGVLVGMPILGLMLGGLWRLAGANPCYEPIKMSLYTYISLGMVNVPEASTRMVSCVILFLVYGSLIFLSGRVKKSKVLVFERPQFTSPA